MRDKELPADEEGAGCGSVFDVAPEDRKRPLFIVDSSQVVERPACKGEAVHTTRGMSSGRRASQRHTGILDDRGGDVLSLQYRHKGAHGAALEAQSSRGETERGDTS